VASTNKDAAPLTRGLERWYGEAKSHQCPLHIVCVGETRTVVSGCSAALEQIANATDAFDKRFGHPR
jgi:hypothetical protein